MKKTFHSKLLIFTMVLCLSIPLLAACVPEDAHWTTEAPTINQEVPPEEASANTEDSSPEETSFAESTEEDSHGETTEETTVEMTEETAPEETTECPHSYEFACSAECALCGEPRADVGEHTYPSDSKCETLTCECGHTLEQSHDMKLSTDSTASLLSAGTVVMRCSKCDKKESTESDAPIDPSLLGMPTVYFTDPEGAEIPLADLEKAQGEITVGIKYVSCDESIPSFEGVTKIKIQGSSSAKYIKKNFTVKLYTDNTLENKLKVDLGWGKENKYCMKANYIDTTQARNIVAAQMFAEVVQTRDNINEGLKNAPNYGLIDGYPILVYINGTYHGIYTMNIPKDSWQFGMEGDETAKEALLMADGWGDYTALRQPIGEITNIDDFENFKFEVEYASNEDDVIWIRDSFNEIVELVNCGDEARIRAELPDHLDIEAAIDNMIFTYFINAADNVAKNILWATYDGKVWIPCMYDMDGSFGNYWNGQPIGTTQKDGYPQNANSIGPYFSSSGKPNVGNNRVWNALVLCFPEEIEARYIKLRESVLTIENTQAHFAAFGARTHPIAYISDVERWDTEDNTNKISYDYANMTRSNMYSTTQAQLEKLDAFFLNLVK